MKFFKKQKPDTNERRRPASINPAVFSYYARGASPSSQNTGRGEGAPLSRLKRYRLSLGHIPSYVAFSAIVLALGYSCTLQPNPKVILINTPDTVHRDPKAYQAAIQAIWKKSIFSRTKLTVSTVGMKRNIASQFSELADVEVELPLLGRRPTVILTPAKPALQLVSSNGAFYVDSTGKVMARTADLTQNDIHNLPLIRDETGVSAEPGKIILPGTEAAFLAKLHAQLLADSIVPQSITLPSGAANEADVRIAGQSYYIKFSIYLDPRHAVWSYLAAKAKLEADHTVPAEYIDVRVEEKVFYK